MKRRQFITLLSGAAVAWPLAARAQQGGKKYVIGRFSAGSATDPLVDVFTEALRELGWVEGENVVFECRYAENRLERLPELAADLVRLKVDVIVATGTLAPLAAKRATSTIPIGLHRYSGTVRGRNPHPCRGRFQGRQGGALDRLLGRSIVRR
jgi:putative tryptophan/tyrosine transport system substrate-binding protein